MRGPVGSLEVPEAVEEHEVLDAEGVAIYLHREVLASIPPSGRLGFAFGGLGRCFLRIEPGAGSRPAAESSAGDRIAPPLGSGRREMAWRRRH